MDSLEKAISLGLVLIPMPGGVLKRYTKDVKQGKSIDAIQYCMIRKVQAFSPDFAFAQDSPLYAVVKWRTDNTFILIVGESHPGPGDTDFIARFETFEDVLDAAIELYFGQPTVIDPWIVPLHHHPELNEAQVRHAIVQARAVTSQEFTRLQQDYQRNALQQFPDNAWERALVGSFLRLEHTSDPQQACMLLRNAQVALIVQS